MNLSIHSVTQGKDRATYVCLNIPLVTSAGGDEIKGITERVVIKYPASAYVPLLLIQAEEVKGQAVAEQKEGGE